MAEYRVVCVDTRPAGDHRHVVGVGVVRGDGALEQRSVKEVRRAIKDKTDSFFTIEEASGRKVPIGRAKCCGDKTIRAVRSGTKTDCLNALASCNRMTWFMAT
jgi:hypothetical protein